MDLTGQTFGRWVVLGKSGKKRYKSCAEYTWLCRCQCGAERAVRGSSLRSGFSSSCGCVRREQARSRRLANHLSLKNRLYRELRNRAKKFGRSFGLTFGEFEALILSPCYYCGTMPSHRRESDYSSPDFCHHGLDRVDNQKGYEVANVASCCKICNAMKSDMTEELFLYQVAKIHQVCQERIR